jgi:hypothetical protein
MDKTTKKVLRATEILEKLIAQKGVIHVSAKYGHGGAQIYVVLEKAQWDSVETVPSNGTKKMRTGKSTITFHWR